MGVNFDPTGDFTIFDTLDPACSWTPKPTGSTVNNVAAVQGSADQKKLMASGLFSTEQTFASWAIYGNTLGTHVPKPGDLFTDGSGAQWFLEEVEYITLTNCYLCQSRKLSPANV